MTPVEAEPTQPSHHPAAVPLAVLVTTYNEENHIAACLEGVSWADEIVVVDSHSTDRTRDLAADFSARVLQREYESPARQKNWGLAQIEHRWVLILDADERVPPELAAEIRALLAAGEPACSAYWLPRHNTFLGRTMRHGGWSSDRVIRLVDRTRARYPDVRVHEEMDVDGRVGELRRSLIHHTLVSFDQYGPKMERYSRWWAADRWERGRRATPWTVLAHTVGRFIRMYLLKLGFLDGGPGLVLALMATFSVYQKYAKLWELGVQERRAGRESAAS